MNYVAAAAAFIGAALVTIFADGDKAQGIALILSLGGITALFV